MELVNCSVSGSGDGEESREIIKWYIRKLKNKYPNYSSSQLAAKIGMSQPTFSRLENAQTKASANSISKLLSALGECHAIADVIARVDSDLAEAIKQVSEKNGRDFEIIGGKLSNFMKQAKYRNIMLLAINKGGTTRQEIEREYGQLGLGGLEHLLSSGVLSDCGGVIEITKGGVSYERNLLQYILAYCLQDSCKAGTWLSCQTKTVDKDKALPAIRKKLDQVRDEIDEMLESKEFAGSDRIVVGMVSDLFLERQRR